MPNPNESMFSVPTVKVEDGKGGFLVINKSDFDDKKHKLYTEPPPADTKTTAKK